MRFSMAAPGIPTPLSLVEGREDSSKRQAAPRSPARKSPFDEIHAAINEALEELEELCDLLDD
jgi:hypothetical protein